AVDSIPAVFGLTRDPFLVFSANLFALLGLRHLYFLIGGLLNRLVYLAAGLAAILAFIGLQLIGGAPRGPGIDHLGPVPVPEISAGASLAVIAAVLLVTTVSSLASGRRAPGKDRTGQTGRPDQAGRAEQADRADGAGQADWAGQADRAG